MKTKHAAGLIAVVLAFIVGAIPGLAQKGVSSPALLVAMAAFLSAVALAHAQDSPSPSSGVAGKKPNILWGDDIGFWNVSACNQGKSDRGEISTFTN